MLRTAAPGDLSGLVSLTVTLQEKISVLPAPAPSVRTGHVQPFLAVLLTGKNGKFVSLTVFSFFKLLLVKDGVNERYSTVYSFFAVN